MLQQHECLKKNRIKKVSEVTLHTAYKEIFFIYFMRRNNLNPVEFEKTNQQMDLENSESFGKIPRAITNALRKGTEKNNVLRNNRIKSEIEDTSDISISCLNRTILAITVMDVLLFKN